MLRFFRAPGRITAASAGRSFSMLSGGLHAAAGLVGRAAPSVMSTFQTFFSTTAHERFAHDVRFSVLRAIEQKTDFSRDFSDHRAVISVVGGGKILMLNMMMQCKTHNNGFSAVENDADYQLRIGRVITHLIQILKENPDISIIALQESPIDEDDVYILRTIIDRYLSEWKAAEFGMTDFGVMTFIRNEHAKPKFHADAGLECALQAVKLANRCHTFTNDRGYKFSNIHVPHGRGKTEGSLKIILGKIIDDAVDGNISKHDIAGDFNCDAVQVRRVLEMVWREKCDRSLAEKKEPLGLRLFAQFDPSIRGHRKADGSEIDADGILSLKFERRDTSKPAFHFEESELSILAGVLLGGVVVVAHTKLMEQEESLSPEDRFDAAVEGGYWR